MQYVRTGLSNYNSINKKTGKQNRQENRKTEQTRKQENNIDKKTGKQYR